jgi:hypothetical protein
MLGMAAAAALRWTLEARAQRKKAPPLAETVGQQQN